MIRRQATLVGTGDGGYVHAGLKKVAADGTETYKFAFEKSSDGTNSEQPLENVKFLDGSPANLEIVDE